MWFAERSILLLVLCAFDAGGFARADAPAPETGWADALPVRIEAERARLADGEDRAVLIAARALLDDPRTMALPDARRAELELLLAAAYDYGETHTAEAIAAAGRALALLGDAASPLAMEALRLRGIAHARRREPQAALADLAAAERAARARGDGSAEHAGVLSDLSLAQRVAGDYGAALASLERALAIRRAQTPPDAVALAQTLIRLGQTRRLIGDLERAAADYREALDLDARMPDPSGRNRAAALYALGNWHRHANEWPRAIEYYAQSVPAFERAWGADSPALSRVLNNYGNAESLLPGHEEAAVALFERALAIARSNRSESPGDYLPIANIAMVRIWQRRFVEAERGFREMIDILRDQPPGGETTPLFSQHGLAAALWGQGRHAEAFDAAAQAEATREAAVRESAATLSDREALIFQEQDYQTLDHALGIALDARDPALLERAWALAMRARGQVTAIQAERLTRARAAGDAAIAPLWREWQAAGAALDAAGSEARAAQRRLDRAERALARALPQARTLTRSEMDFAALRAALPPGSALVWLHDLRHRRAQDFANQAVGFADPVTFAFVLRAGKDARAQAVELGAAPVIAQALAQWQALLATPDSSLDLVRERGRTLAELTWAKLAPPIGDAARVFVIAEGPLLRLPWSALPDGEGWLADGHVRFHALNHERELLLPAVQEDGTAWRLFAIADPRGDGAAPCADLPALPGARREVERLRELFGDEALLALTGADASEARFRAEAPRAALLHLATHGIDAGSACAGASGAATRGLSLSAEPATGASATALVLAAPAVPRGADDDGLLAHPEIAALDLSSVQWAVLAACSTAAGSTHAYEGLYGLARAFRLAGARTTILSLWPVSDQATAQWSEALYAARINDRADTPEAMRRAELAVLAARRAAGLAEHPWYWAGFMAIGGWQ